MNLLYPELLLLAIPVAVAFWRTSHWRSVRGVLRLLAVVCLLLALTGPHGGGTVHGRDLVLVVDRSRSMPTGGSATVAELVELASQEMQPGDRLSVLTFAADSMLEQAPQERVVFEGYSAELDGDGSNLTTALEQALALIPENRPGSILLYSDGEFHGVDPSSVTRRAAARGVRIDIRSARRTSAVDVAVEELELPATVEIGEPFQFSAWVRSDRPTDAAYTLYRGEKIISQGTRTLRAGLNQLLFRDLGQAAGLAHYRLSMEVEGDQILENNHGLGVLRTEGQRPLLLLNQTGTVGRLAATLRAAGLRVSVARAADVADLDPSFLEAYRGVILENLPADSLGRMLPGIARQVEDLGGGLLVTGGQASFGVGGYYRSALDPLLPVTMEVRVEHRKMGLALAFVLDRSGSMGASVAGGRTKMDLANAGTMEGIMLLGPMDQVSVIAVDSEPHLVVPLSEVKNPSDFASKVSGIQSGGGGIYVYNGLEAAARELAQSSRANRHIVLFADAADAEQPGAYKTLLAELKDKFNTTVSVVALGTGADSDADFLRDVAQRGGGEVYFSQDPADLPRLFAQDTLLAARSSFVDVPTATRATPALFTMANLAPGPWLNLPGYNLCYLRPGAAMGVVSTDEYASPILATMQAGLGRTAAFTGQVSGNFGIAEANWPEVAKTLVTVARWIGGMDPPAQYFSSVHREGRQAVVTIEVDRDLPGATPGPLSARMVAPDGRTSVLELVPISADVYQARAPLGMEGVYRFAAATEDGELLQMEALAVPYSPEFEPRLERDSGERVLGRIARLSRGRMNPPASEFYRGDRRSQALKPLAPWFGLAGLILILAEIAWRRLFELEFQAKRRQRSSQLPKPRKQAIGRPSTTSESISDTAGPAPKADQAQSQDLDDLLSGAKRKARRRNRD
jgi:Mg-chelatase subunit ChlD